MVARRAFWFQLRIFERAEISVSRVGASSFEPTLVDIKATILRIVFFGFAQVPFTGKECGVAFGLEGLSQRDFRERHVIGKFGGAKFSGAFSAKEIRCTSTRGILAGQQAVASR